jgi:hypothetical protein
VLVKRGRITPGQKEDALLVQGETGRPVGEVLRMLGSVGQSDVAAAVQVQLSHRLAKIIGMKQPLCRFAERPEPYLPAAGERHAEKPELDVIRRLLHERVQLYLRHPFLSSQVPSYLVDTEIPASSCCRPDTGRATSRRPICSERSGWCSTGCAPCSTWSWSTRRRSHARFRPARSPVSSTACCWS